MESVFDISNLSTYMENNSLEAKTAKDSLPNSIWDTYSSFANTNGGVILLGVVEQTNHTLIVHGVTDAHKLVYDFWNTIHNPQKVSLNILTDHMVDVLNVDGKDIVRICVPRADRRQRPIYIGDNPIKGTYCRDGEGDFLCTKDQVAAMYRDASDISIDLKVMKNMDVSVFDMDTVHRYRNRFAQFHSGHVWLDDDDVLFLRHIGAMIAGDDGIFHPTSAGLLMFGHEYDIVREFPHYFLDYQEKFSNDTRWTHRFVSTSGDWSGNLYDFFFRVYSHITADLPIPFITQGGNRKDEMELHLALREALTNSLVHSDFYERQGVVIVKNEKEIQFSNPGNIRIGIKEALAGGVSDPRNMTLLKMFSLVDVGERAGSGIPGLIHSWVYWVEKEPSFSISFNPARTMVVIPASAADFRRASKKQVKIGGLKVDSGGLKVDSSGLKVDSGGLKVDRNGLSETALKILALYDENPNLTYDEIAECLGKARSGIAKHIKRLKKLGFLPFS